MAQMGPTDLVYSILNSSSNPWQVAVLDNTIPWTDWVKFCKILEILEF